MTPEHAHLILNHVPILGGIFGGLVLLWGTWRGSRDLSRAGLALVLIAGLFAIPVYLSGNAAEERAEELPGVSHEILEEHEDAGLYALVAAAIAGLLAAIGLALSRNSRAVPRWIAVATLTVTVLSSWIIARTANLGGQIRHSEIRPAAGQGAGEIADPD